MKKIMANFRQIAQVLLIVIVCCLPYMVDIPSLFEDYLRNHKPKPEFWDFITYYILKNGNIVILMALLIAASLLIRKWNKDFIMNNDNVYHDYPFGWYWFCAKGLGIKKCNLILVPIYMQFKLVIKNIFEEYPFDEAAFPIIDGEPECIIEKENMEADLSEINLILEDTYVIKPEQIPCSKQNLPTIKISRNIGNSHTRHYSPNFINAISEEIRKLPQVSIVNIYATTNPKNTVQIILSTFKMADRGNVEHVFVYQQENSGKRRFNKEGHKIY